MFVRTSSGILLNVSSASRSNGVDVGSVTCSLIPVPPYTQATLRPSVFANFLHSLNVCRASSRVGVISTAANKSNTTYTHIKNDSTFHRRL